MRKQEVDTETHGALEFHLLKINEKEEGGESSGTSLGETFIIAIVLIAALVFLCIISGCTFMIWRCGFCPERRSRRRRNYSKSSTMSSRKRPHDSEDSMELGKLRIKLWKLETKSAKKEEEQERKEKEQERKEKELEMKEEETSKKGLHVITEVGSLPEMDEMETVSMEDYNRRLDQATKLIKDFEKARMVVNHHKENIKLGATLGYIGGAGAGGH